MQTIKTYPAPNACIYCGFKRERDKRKGRQFGREHIIPLALGGTLIFLNASCDQCGATFNKEFEREFISDFADTRAHLRLRSRKRKAAYATGRMVVTEGGISRFVDVPIGIHPAKIVAPVTRQPCELLSGEPEGSRPATGWTIDGLAVALSEIGLWGRFQSRFSPDNWGRAIAKMAHAFMVAETAEKYQPVLLDFVFGRNTHYGSHIGGALHPATEQFYPHSISLEERGKYAVVTIGLFTSLLSSLTLDVVAGLVREGS